MCLKEGLSRSSCISTTNPASEKVVLYVTILIEVKCYMEWSDVFQKITTEHDFSEMHHFLENEYTTETAVSYTHLTLPTKRIV